MTDTHIGRERHRALKREKARERKMKAWQKYFFGRGPIFDDDVSKHQFFCFSEEKFVSKYFVADNLLMFLTEIEFGPNFVLPVFRTIGTGPIRFQLLFLFGR